MVGESSVLKQLRKKKAGKAGLAYRRRTAGQLLDSWNKDRRREACKPQAYCVGLEDSKQVKPGLKSRDAGCSELAISSRHELFGAELDAGRECGLGGWQGRSSRSPTPAKPPALRLLDHHQRFTAGMVVVFAYCVNLR